jgi:predicted TIM-barrel fold metal-dependent hydrolase
VHGIARRVVLLLPVPALAGCCVLAGPLAGGSTKPSDEATVPLSPEARALIDRAFLGIDREKQVDVHIHIAGIGSGATGCCVNPSMRSALHPIKRLQFEVYMRAAGVSHAQEADREYVLRLVERARAAPRRGRFRILAFDRRYRQDGSVDEKRTEFYVPNDYVFRLAEEFPDVFLPTMSVHPYRPDALEELERWAGRGGTMVKWLPNSQGIDPSDPLCDRYYDRMRELGLVLLSHAGEEKAVDAAEDQRLGNPLLLRRALDHGVRVIAAHCASLGDNVDLDDPGRGKVRNFELFLRLMDEEKYKRLLFGEISAITQYNRFGETLAVLLERSDLHGRLVNGSDYPLPAINALIRTRSLVSAGFISKEERDALNEIFDSNPLLFDFVLKRTLHLPGGDRRFPASMFMEHPGLGANHE